MSIKHDPVDNALRSLGGRQWPGENHNLELENKLMQSMETHKANSWITRHRVAASVLGVLVLASAGFAAAGGVEMVRSWFVSISINGEVVAEGEYAVDETGTATIPLPEIQTEGDEAVISIELGSEEVPEGGSGQRTVNVSIEDGEAKIQVVPEDEEDD